MIDYLTSFCLDNIIVKPNSFRLSLVNNLKDSIGKCIYNNNYKSLTIRINTKFLSLTNIINEYEEYNNDRIIGKYLTDDLFVKCKIVCCHEIAHYFTFLDSYEGKCDLTEKAHGITFQNYYRKLRLNNNLYKR